MTRSAWWVFCDALAVYRLAVLVTRDAIMEPTRAWLLATAKVRAQDRATSGLDGSKPGLYGRLWNLVTCAWCSSIWAAVLVVALTKLVPGVWQYPAMGLALSAVAGFLSERS